MNTHPLVSILMTAYNREDFIAEAIESVLASTFTNFELIIVDDMSKDNTVSIAKAYKEKDERIFLYLNEQNIGQFANRNKAAALAKGKYIKYLDSDDTIAKNGLEEMVLSMEKYVSDAGIGICYYFKSPFVTNINFPILLTSADAYKSNFEGGGLLCAGPTHSIYLKEKFDFVNGFDDSFGINTDVHLHLKIAAISKVVLFSENLVLWRRHDKQVHEGQADKFNMLKEKFIINKDILHSKYCPSNSSDKKRFYKIQQILLARNLIKMFLVKGKFKLLFKFFSNQTIVFFQLFYAFIPIRLLK